MQPWPGNFNKAGTFGYANALLLFDVSSKQGRAKKKKLKVGIALVSNRFTYE